MNTAKLMKIIETLELEDMDAITALASEALKKAESRIQDVENLAKDMGVKLGIREFDTVSDFIYAEIGVRGIDGRDIREFANDRWHLLWYKIRDTVGDFYIWLYADVNEKNGTIKFQNVGENHYLLEYQEEKDLLLTKYKNGNRVYETNENILEYYDLIQYIYYSSFLNGHAYPKQ